MIRCKNVKFRIKGLFCQKQKKVFLVVKLEEQVGVVLD